jgi:hypothetical protein
MKTWAYLTASELVDSERTLWKSSQQESFSEEIRCLMNKQEINKSTSLIKMPPFLDDYGVLRCRSRLQLAEWIPYDVRFPVILHPRHPITKMIIVGLHLRFNHQGVETVINEMRQRYQVSSLRATVKKVFYECLERKIRKCVPDVPEMGDLPLCRLQPNVHAFSRTGVDFFGPLEVTVRRSHEKRYGVIFTCLSTRAIYLELAGSLSTDSCIMAMRRFFARRGEPLEILSDNGTNFRGVATELQKSINELNKGKLMEECAIKGIKW